MFELFNGWSANLSLIIAAIFEIIVISYIYGIKKFLHHNTDGMGIYMPLPLKVYWYSTWFIITPGLLSVSILFIFVWNIYTKIILRIMMK